MLQWLADVTAAELPLKADLGAARQHLGDTAEEQHRSQRDDERRHAEARHDRALSDADRNRENDGEDDRADDAEALHHRHVTGRHRDDADDGSDGQIDAARDDDHRLAAREQRDQRDVPDVVSEVVDPEKARVQDRGGDRQRDQHPQHRQFFLERSHLLLSSLSPSGSQLQDVRVGQLFAAELAGDLAAREDQRAVTERRDLVRL